MNNADLLTLTQWLSPSYPVGAFSYSHGLETAISDGRITTSDHVKHWLTALIERGSGWSDLVFLSAAYRANTADDLAAISELAEALCPSLERLNETRQQGAAFTRATNSIWSLNVTPAPYPVAVGTAARVRNIDLETTAYLYIHSFASNLVSAATRLIPLGQTDGQACLQDLACVCTRTAPKALDATIEDIGTCAFASDIASMRHETQTTRIFQS